MKNKILLILIALTLTGCGATVATQETQENAVQQSAENTARETAVSTTTTTQEPSESTTPKSTENDPVAAEMVDRAFRLASGYNRTLNITKDGETESVTIEGNKNDGDVHYDKVLRIEFDNPHKVDASGSDPEFRDYGAYAIDPGVLDTLDLIDSSCFTGLKASGDTVTGKASLFDQGELDCTMVIEDGVLKNLKATGDGVTAELTTGDYVNAISDEDTFTIYEGGDGIFPTTDKATFDFEGMGADALIEAAYNHEPLKDEGTGMTFCLTYDIYKNGSNPELTGHGVNAPNYVDISELTLDDIYVNPCIRYEYTKGHTLGDLESIMKRLRQYQLKMNDSTENKKRASDKWFTTGSNDLPRWYYELVYGDYETREQQSKDFWESINGK